MGGGDLSLGQHIGMGARSLREAGTEIYDQVAAQKQREIARQLAEAQIARAKLEAAGLQNDLDMYDAMQAAIEERYPVGGPGQQAGAPSPAVPFAPQAGPRTPTTPITPGTLGGPRGLGPRAMPGMTLGTLGGQTQLQPSPAPATNMWLGAGAGAPAPQLGAQPQAQPTAAAAQAMSGTPRRPITRLDQIQIQQAMQNGTWGPAMAFHMGLIGADELPEDIRIAMRLAAGFEWSNISPVQQAELDLAQERNDIAQSELALNQWAAEANLALSREDLELRRDAQTWAQEMDWREFNTLSPARVAELTLAYQHGVTLAQVQHGHRMSEIGETGRQGRLTDPGQAAGAITPGSPEASRIQSSYLEMHQLLDQPFADRTYVPPGETAADREAARRAFFGDDYAGLVAMRDQYRNQLVEAGVIDANAQLPEVHSQEWNILTKGPTIWALGMSEEGFSPEVIEDTLANYTAATTGARVSAERIETIMTMLDALEARREPTPRRGGFRIGSPFAGGWRPPASSMPFSSGLR